ncbi:MAG: acyltransferase family protein, partial [Phycisphaerales bacterium]|nr:acyltransferase family protein [Phycisphaerales bacterium]
MTIAPAPNLPAVDPVPAAPARPASGSPRRALHIPALDGVRGLAILLVLAFHFSQAAYSNQASGLRLAVQRLTGAGWVGVDLFFVLSGFLITSILYEAVGTRGYFKNFYMRRVLRIFPLYFGALAVAFGLIPLLFGPQPHYADVYRNQWALWLYAQNFVPIDWRAFSHFWSLAVEEHFYMVWPAVVLALGRRGGMTACGVMILAAVSVRCYRAAYVPGGWEQTYIWTFCRMDSLAIGSLLALAVGGAAADLRRFARPAPWVLAAAAAGCA